MKTATDLLLVLVLGIKFIAISAIITAVVCALMLIPFGFYKSNGGKKKYFAYCGKVFFNLFNLINEGIEYIFTI